jgi:hypothetical protein
MRGSRRFLSKDTIWKREASEIVRLAGEGLEIRL